MSQLAPHNVGITTSPPELFLVVLVSNAVRYLMDIRPTRVTYPFD